MATIWLTCRLPFNRHNISVNAQLRDAIKSQIVQWTGWTGSPHTVEWCLHIESANVTNQDVVIYFVYNWGHSTGLVRHRVNEITADDALDDRFRAAMATLKLQARSQALSSNGTGIAGITSPDTPVISEVWMRPVLAAVRGFSMHNPNWNSTEIQQASRAFAIAALHEAGHNKIETSMQRTNTNWDLHLNGGGGIFAANAILLSPRLIPSQRNLQLLSQHIDFPRAQSIIAHTLRKLVDSLDNIFKEMCWSPHTFEFVRLVMK